MAPLKTALIGCGRIAGKHVKAIRELSDELELVAVCDIVPERAERIAREAGVPAYTDYRQMVAQEKLDLAHILTWSGNHASIAADCARNVPNLLVEKPMALRLTDADNLIETCDRTGTRLFVVKQNRYNPPVVALKEALDAGRFGRLILGTVRVRWSRSPEYYRQDRWRGTWAWDGGVLANQASHHVDLLVWIFGPVESVFAKTGKFLAPIEAEDTGVVMLKFRSGALGIVEATTCTRPRDLEGSLSVLGSGGTAEIGGFAVNEMKVWQFVDARPEDAAIFSTSTQPPDVYGFGHLALLQDVVQAIRENKRFMIDGLEGRRSVEILNAIYESVERGREVTVTFAPSFCRLGETPNETP
jgi:UDP-N-acetyl-2-amino-2-deoxyglucuronate dehydrogenase